MKLILNNIKKDYYREKKTYAVIDNITFNLLDGEIITIVGKSGCGKSTLLNIISGLDNKTGGEIFFNKKTPKISYMFQNDALLSYKNTLDNALLGLKLRKELDDNKLTSVKKMLIEYGLKEHLYKKTSTLSGGQKQRVALVRALAIEPDLLLLDEPFSALDYITRVNIANDVYQKLKSKKLSAIIITHDIGEAICLGDKIIVLTGEPSTIKSTYTTNFKNSLSIQEKRNTALFNDLYEKIWSDLND